MKKLIATIFLCLSSVHLCAGMLDVRLVAGNNPCIKKKMPHCPPWEDFYAPEGINNPDFIKKDGLIPASDGKEFGVYSRGGLYVDINSRVRADEIIAHKDLCGIIDEGEVGIERVLLYTNKKWSVFSYDVAQSMLMEELGKLEKLGESEFSELKKPVFTAESGEKKDIMGAYRYKEGGKECILYHLRTLSQ